MITSISNPEYDRLRDRLPRMFQRLCDSMCIPCSMSELRSHLADIASQTGMGDEYVWNAMARRMDLRLVPVDGSFRGLVVTIRERLPILVQVPDNDDPDRFELLLISSQPKRNRFRVVEPDGQESDLTLRQLRKRVMNGTSSQFTWYLVQPLLPAQAASKYQTGAEAAQTPPRPIVRLLELLRPEGDDIRTVFIFSVVIGILSLTTPLAVEAVVNTIAFGRYLQPLVILSLMVFVFLAFRAGLNIVTTIIVEVIQRRLFVRVVDDVAFRLVHMPANYLADRGIHGPELVNRFFDVVNLQKITSKFLLETLMLVLQTVIGLAVLAFYHPFLLGYDIGLIAMMAVVLLLIGRGAVKTAKQESSVKYRTAAWLQELVRHPNAFRLGGGSEFALDRADVLAAEYVQHRREHFRIVIRQVSFSMLMQAAAATVLLGLGGYLVIDGQMTLGQLVAAELIVTVILGSFTKLGKDLESFYDLLASIDKLGYLFDLPVQRRTGLSLSDQNQKRTLQAVGLIPAVGDPQLDLVINPGESLAVWGSDRRQQDRVMQSLAGLRKPQAGAATLDGVQLTTLSEESLRVHIAFVRDAEVFEGSVVDNLRMGRVSVSSSQIAEIIDRIGLSGTVQRLNQDLETPVGPVSGPLTECEAIRLTLARALIGRPSVLFLDRILDRLSDDEIDEVLGRLEKFQDETTLIVNTGRQQIRNWAERVIDMAA